MSEFSALRGIKTHFGPKFQAVGINLYLQLELNHRNSRSVVIILVGMLFSEPPAIWYFAKQAGVKRVCPKNVMAHTLKTLTSLNKEVRPFFLGDNRIWSFPFLKAF